MAKVARYTEAKTIVYDKPLLEAVEKYVDEKNLSFSEFVREACMRYFAILGVEYKEE